MAPRLLVTGLLLVALPASASIFQHHTSQADIEQRIVQRPLVVGKGWVELGLGIDYKYSTSQFLESDSANVGFSKDNHYESFDNGGVLNLTRFSLNFRWGFTKGTDLYLRVPFLWNNLQNNLTVDNWEEVDGIQEGTTRVEVDADGQEHYYVNNPRQTNINTFAIGDVEMGVLVQWLRRQDPKGRYNTALGSHIEVKAPTGLESPGSYISSPGLVTVLPTGTGTYNFGVDLEYKQQIDFMAVNVYGGFVWRTSGIVQYLIEDQEHYFNLRLKPGDAIEWGLMLTFQPARFLAIAVGTDMEYRFPTKIGPSDRSIAQCKECQPVDGSDGLDMDGVVQVSITPSRVWQVDIRAEYTLGGRPAYLVPLEDISPARGLTAGAAVMYRF